MGYVTWHGGLDQVLTQLLFKSWGGDRSELSLLKEAGERARPAGPSSSRHQLSLTGHHLVSPANLTHASLSCHVTAPWKGRGWAHCQT